MRITKKGKELKALLQADEDILDLINNGNGIDDSSSVQSNQNASNQQRKKRAMQASGMESIINHVEKLPHPVCHDCDESLPSARLHACLECVHIACWKDHLNAHMDGKGHSFAVDFNNCTLYCRKCKDYVYDDEFERVLFSEQYNLDYIISRIREPFAAKPIHPLWTPSPEESKEIASLSKVIMCSGMRGLLNLGSTCFMNSILQTIIHNPILKAHFLSGKHSPANCSKSKATCMACQLDGLFGEFYSTENTPFAPSSVLHAMWISQTHMAGYSQQDAHEFFISFLDEIHNSACPPNQRHLGQTLCPCIVHQVFGGVLQSDVTCSGCNAISLTRDPILDLSLEISKVSAKKKKGEDSVVTLSDCLEEYTMPEKLSVYTCKSCGASAEAMKQLSINTLPPVLSIQLKRFEHSEKSSSKIDTYVKIPVALDMTPLTTRAVKMKTILNSGVKGRRGPAPFDSVSDGIPSYKYSLFGVITHIGKIDTGHYKAYCRVRDGWFLFDDHNVTSVELDEVFQSNVYMCFYVRDHCEYHFGEVSSSEEADDIIMIA